MNGVGDLVERLEGGIGIGIEDNIGYFWFYVFFLLVCLLGYWYLFLIEGLLGC